MANCLDNLKLPPLVILLLFLFVVFYLTVTAILEHKKASESPYKF